ncbi:hypothetical protein [Burkholderia anthina]|nr:hypothetical protein [Burkholderia anthina]QTD89943.1 hypothetical protein J4G50_00650 [Burkholderia anthina]
MEANQLGSQVDAERLVREGNLEVAVRQEPADFTVINVEGCLSSSSVLG